MNVNLIEEMTKGFDPVARHEVLEGLRNGFPLGVESEPPPRSWAPSFMDDASRDRITAHFEAEVEAKRMLGPFTTKPSGRFWSGASRYLSLSRRSRREAASSGRFSTFLMIMITRSMRVFQ